MANTAKTLKANGLNVHQIAYWKKRLGANASASQILKARSKQIYNHNPQAFGPNTNLTPIQLNKDVNAASTLQFGDTQTQLNNQIGQVDPIYNAYATSIFNAQAAAKSAADAANAQITQGAQNVETQNDTARSQLLQQMQADAAKRGGTVDNSLFANDLQAGAARQAQANSQAALASTLGQNAQTFLTGQGALGEAARAQRKADLGNQKTQLAKQIGAFKTTQRTNEIQNAQKQGIELGTLGIQQQNANTSARLASGNLSAKRSASRTAKGNLNERIRNDKTNAKLKARGQDISASLRRDSQNMSRAQFIAKYGITPEQANKGAKPKRGLKGSGAGGLTPTQVRKYGSLRDKAISTMQLDPKKPSAKNPGSVSQWANALTAKLNMPHDLATAVVDKFVYGAVDKKTAARMYQRYGVHLKVFKPGAGALAEPNT